MTTRILPAQLPPTGASSSSSPPPAPTQSTPTSPGFPFPATIPPRTSSSRGQSHPAPAPAPAHSHPHHSSTYGPSASLDIPRRPRPQSSDPTALHDFTADDSFSGPVSYFDHIPLSTANNNAAAATAAALPSSSNTNSLSNSLNASASAAANAASATITAAGVSVRSAKQVFTQMLGENGHPAAAGGAASAAAAAAGYDERGQRIQSQTLPSHVRSHSQGHNAHGHHHQHAASVSASHHHPHPYAQHTASAAATAAARHQRPPIENLFSTPHSSHHQQQHQHQQQQSQSQSQSQQRQTITLPIGKPREDSSSHQQQQQPSQSQSHGHSRSHSHPHAQQQQQQQPPSAAAFAAAQQYQNQQAAAAAAAAAATAGGGGAGAGAGNPTGSTRKSKQDYATTRRRETTFGHYVLGQTLGEGEFGKVKLGWKRENGAQVAIKLIRRETLGNNPQRLPKIYREINILKELNHPNIVRLHEIVETDRYIGIILAYASGGELFDYILKHRYLKDNSARKLFAQLISGVGYLHKKGIVHRDLKLENLLLDKNRNIIITDFGFANTFNPADELGTEVEYALGNKDVVRRLRLDKPDRNGMRRGDLMQTSCGSPCYAAPELVVSDSLYTARKVDVWSCGVILYAMLAGYLPFDDDPANPDGDNINLLYKYIVSTPLVFPEHITPHARDLLRRILVPDPRRRADLFEVARHSWLAEYANLVTEVTSGRAKVDGVDAKNAGKATASGGNAAANAGAGAAPAGPVAAGATGAAAVTAGQTAGGAGIDSGAEGKKKSGRITSAPVSPAFLSALHVFRAASASVEHSSPPSNRSSVRSVAVAGALPAAKAAAAATTSTSIAPTTSTSPYTSSNAVADSNTSSADVIKDPTDAPLMITRSASVRTANQNQKQGRHGHHVHMHSHHHAPTGTTVIGGLAHQSGKITPDFHSTLNIDSPVAAAAAAAATGGRYTSDSEAGSSTLQFPMGGTFPPGVSATDFQNAYSSAGAVPPGPPVGAVRASPSRGESKSAREAKRRTLQIEYVPPSTSTSRTKVTEPSSAVSGSAGGGAAGNAFAVNDPLAESAGSKTPTQQSPQRQTSDRDTVARSISDLTGAYGTLPQQSTTTPTPTAPQQPEKPTLNKPLLTDHMADIVPSALSSTAANASKNSLPFIVDRHQNTATPTNHRNNLNTPVGGASANSVNRNSWNHPMPPSSRGSYAMPSAPAVSSTNAQAKMAESASGETSRSASLSAATALGNGGNAAQSPRDAFPGVQPRPNRSGGGGKNSWRRSTHLDMLSSSPSIGGSGNASGGNNAAAGMPSTPGSSGGTFRGHKRASTAGSLTEKLFGRSSGTIGRFLSGSQREAAAAAAASGSGTGAGSGGQDKERVSTKKYPPVSMRDPKNSDDKDSRKSTESSSRRSFYKGSFRARRGSSSHGERERERERDRDRERERDRDRDGTASVSSKGKSRRFSILPNMFTRFSGGSQASSIGRSERDKASVAGARSLQGSPVPQAGRQSPVPNLNDNAVGSGATGSGRMSALGIDAQMQHLNDYNSSSGQGITPTTVTSAGAGDSRGQQQQQPHLDIPLSPSGQDVSLSDQIDQQFAELHRKQEQEYQYKGHGNTKQQQQGASQGPQIPTRQSTRKSQHRSGSRSAGASPEMTNENDAMFSNNPSSSSNTNNNNNNAAYGYAKHNIYNPNLNTDERRAPNTIGHSGGAAAAAAAAAAAGGNNNNNAPGSRNSVGLGLGLNMNIDQHHQHAQHQQQQQSTTARSEQTSSPNMSDSPAIGSSGDRERGTNMLQGNRRKFADAYESERGPAAHSGSSGAAKRVMDFFRRKGKARGGEV